MKDVIAHRGASAYAPENTMAAFQRALAMGCRAIEFDVMLSADDQLFVFHDEKLNRTTNGKGGFGLANADYIQSLDAGRWFSKRFQGEKIPQFSTVLEWLLQNDVEANIEIKPYPNTTEKTTIAVLTALNRYWPREKSLPLISSFDWEALTISRNYSPELPLGLLLDDWQEDWQVHAERLQCQSINLSQHITTAKRVKLIKSHGYDVYVYTVNRKRQACQFLDWGVDAVFSDYPDLLGKMRDNAV